MARDAAASPRSPAPSARVDDVKEAALRLFAERGYHGTTMSQIAEAVGVRVPTLYSHIRAKQTLLADIAVETTEQVWSEFDSAVAGVADPAGRLRAAVEVYALRHATHRCEALVVNRDASSLDEPVRTQVFRRREEHEHAVRTLIEEGIAAGVMHVDSPALASFAILEMSVSIARWFREDGPLSAEQVAREYGEFALRLSGAGAAASEPAS
jgi:AcrR family transcriptional regulator